MINLDTLATDINREQARRAYHGTSFSPEKRGDSVIDSYISTMKQLAAFIELNAKDEKQRVIKQEVFDNLKEKYKNRTLMLLNAQSRCLSSMVCGPSNFPVRRAEKANLLQHKRSSEWLEFHNNLEKYALKNLQSVFTCAEKQGTELEQYHLKVAATEKMQQIMKNVNKTHKAFLKAPDSPATIKLMAALPEKWQEQIKIYKPRYSWEPHPFAPYELTNNNANLKRMKLRLAELEKKAEALKKREEADQQLKGVIVRRNFAEDRLQLLFDDKPLSEVISTLKANGFKWSPRFGAWQRQLTSNALYATKRMLQTETMQQFI